MIRPIRSETEYDEALEEIELYFENAPKPATPQADRFGLLALLVEDQERKRWPIASTRRQLFAMIAAIAGFMAGSVAHAQTSGKSTGCLGMNGERLPTQATFDDGSIVTVLERSSGKLRYEVVSPGKVKASMLTYGLFTLTSESPTVTFEFTWNQDLTQFMPLKVGQRIVADASLKSSLNKDVRSYATQMTVTEVESVRIGECEYPVFKIDVVSQQSDASAPSAIIRYYHEPSMLTLRTVLTIPATANAPSRIVDRRVVELK